MPTRLLVISLGGALGALARYAVSEWFVRRIPAGTLLVNVVGCFLIGLAMGLSVEHRWMTPNVRLFFVTGFLGALTTFSTFGWQTFSLAEKKDFYLAAFNIGLNLFGSLIAVVIGFQIAVLLNRPAT